MKIFFPTDGNTNVINYNLQPLFNGLYGKFCQEKEINGISTKNGDILIKSAISGDRVYDEMIFENAKAYFGENLGFLELINESHKHASHAAMRENPDL